MNFLTRPALKIFIIYLVIGSLYIYFSDSLVQSIFTDTKTLSLAQTIKGWAFIVVTGIIIAYLINREILKKDTAFKHVNDSKIKYKTLSFELQQTHRQLKESLAKLAESENKFRSIVENANDIIFSLDLKGNITYVSPNWENILGHDPEDITGMNFTSFIHPKDINTGLQYLEMTAVSGKKSEGIEYRVKHADGSWRWHVTNGSPILDERNNVTSFIGIARDITNQKIIERDLIDAKEKAEENNRLKTAFLNNMSHEIRTPMNGILGFSELLSAPDLTPEKKETYISVIKTSSQQLLSIINDILDISKLEAGLIKTHIEKFRINPVMDTIAELVENQLSITDKDVRLIIEKGLVDHEDTIETDKNRLIQIITNLATNAVKFTHEGSVTIGYHVGDEGLTIYVKDTGIGIPEKARNLIFERFRQADETIKRAYGGTGLGLAIAREFAKLLNGDITLESEVNKGSAFTLTLPYKRLRIKKNVSQVISNKIPLPMKKSILIAEDDQTSLQLIKEFLNGLNTRFFVAHNGNQAVEIASREKDLDLILMDLRMPEMDGLEATRRIKAVHPDIPIIAQTAYAMPGDREKAMDAGCVDYITKPIDKKKFLNLISAYT